jgi:hypothetical protein
MAAVVTRRRKPFGGNFDRDCGRRTVPAKALYLYIMLTWLFCLLRGVRWVWIVTIGLYTLGLVSYLISVFPEWHFDALSVVGLFLLLLPITRRYFSSNTVVARA